MSFTIFPMYCVKNMLRQSFEKTKFCNARFYLCWLLLSLIPYRLHCQLQLTLCPFRFFILNRWVNPFMGYGAKKDLEVGDLYDVMPGDHSEELGLKLKK